MPPHQDRYEVSLKLVTIVGTEYAMQANLSHYENVAELEDDILCFLPTVSDLDVFGCKLDLLDLHTQQLLPEAFRTVLLQRPQLQIVVRLCMVRTFHLAVPASYGRCASTTGEALCGKTGFCCGFWTPNWCPQKSLFFHSLKEQKVGKTSEI